MRVLVSVASRHGATGEMGGVIAAALAGCGLEVDVVAPDDVEHVQQYDAVILGTAIYVGRAMASMRALVQRQGAHLRARPVWVFWSGPVGEGTATPPAPDDVDAIATATEARGVQCFVGAIDKAALDLSERALVALVRARDGDFRDLDLVEAWARSVGETLTGTDSPVRTVDAS